MKQISEIIPSKIEQGTEKITNSRQLIIKDFIDIINLERKGTKYKPLTARAIAIKLSHLSEQDLHFFYKKCSNAKSFSKCFWGCLKNYRIG